MTQIYPRITLFSGLLIVFLVLLSGSSDAQLIIERELLGAVSTQTFASPASGQSLLVEASLGEPIIGYREGEIIIKVGFQQPSTTESDGDGFAPEVEEQPREEDEAVTIRVGTYPNPTVERLTVDLESVPGMFRELQLVDPFGRVMITKRVNGETTVVLTQLQELPNANYFLVGIDQRGRMHRINTIMIITY